MKFYILTWQETHGGPGLLSVHPTESSVWKALAEYGTRMFCGENGFVIDSVDFGKTKPRDVIMELLAGNPPLKTRIWPLWFNRSAPVKQS